MNTDNKDAARDDTAGTLLDVCNPGGEVSIESPYRRGDDEVIQAGSHGAIRLRENAHELAGAIAIHSVSSHLRAGYDSSCSGCRSSRGLVNEKGSFQIAVSI